ncbi:MAG: DUF3135 domain-containing protein [Ectothiorhodospiraceae bacterium]|jgi:hypothetical protein
MRFDFDQWATLASDDPEKFETKRQAEIDAFISAQRASRQQHLRRLQWRIDRERERCGTPLAACIRLSNMMWGSFAGPNGLAESLNGVPASRKRLPATNGKVLPFRTRKH